MQPKKRANRINLGDQQFSIKKKYIQTTLDNKTQVMQIE